MTELHMHLIVYYFTMLGFTVVHTTQIDDEDLTIENLSIYLISCWLLVPMFLIYILWDRIKGNISLKSLLKIVLLKRRSSKEQK